MAKVEMMFTLRRAYGKKKILKKENIKKIKKILPSFTSKCWPCTISIIYKFYNCDYLNNKNYKIKSPLSLWYIIQTDHI